MALSLEDIEVIMEYVEVKCAQATAHARGEHVSKDAVEFAEQQLRLRAEDG